MGLFKYGKWLLLITYAMGFSILLIDLILAIKVQNYNFGHGRGNKRKNGYRGHYGCDTEMRPRFCTIVDVLVVWHINLKMMY